jgi:hypothetical protein
MEKPSRLTSSSLRRNEVGSRESGDIVSFRGLDVWNRSIDLVDVVIAESNRLPRSEFDLRRQMRRAAVSIPANLAEGYRRKGRRGAYQNHVSIAMGFPTPGLVDSRLRLPVPDSRLPSASEIIRMPIHHFGRCQRRKRQHAIAQGANHQHFLGRR